MVVITLFRWSYKPFLNYKVGPSSLAKLVNITPITMVDGIYNYSFHGGYKTTHSVWGAHLVGALHCKMVVGLHLPHMLSFPAASSIAVGCCGTELPDNGIYPTRPTRWGPQTL